MKIAFNPSTVAALITPPNNKDITFDLRGRNIFARGVKFCGTDTWRDIKINNVSIGSNILDLRNGSNTTLTNTNGVVTINSTWRPVVDNLTSDSTTSSLSANLGRVLKSLIDGKSNSGHNHDDRYLKLTGGTMTGNIILRQNVTITKPLVSVSNYDSVVRWSVDGETKQYGREIGLHNIGGSDSSGSIAIVPYKTDIYPWSGTVGLFIAKNTLKLDGKPIAFKSDIPTSLKNPYSLTLLANGTTLATYDGSVSKIVNLTYDNVGAAAKNHTHNSLEPWASYITGDSHAAVLKSIFNKNKTSIPRNKFISVYSSAYGNGSYYMGYFLLGYENNPYGGFFVAHYDAAYYIGISNGSFTLNRLVYSTDIPSSLKNPYSLTTFGVVYDGSAAKVVGPSNFISLVTEGTDTVTDGTMFITSYASNSGFADTNAVNIPYKRKAIHLWEYVRAKTDSLYATKSHNHDDRYLRLTGGWMSGDINFGGDNRICWGRNTDSASISFKNDGDGDTDSYMSFVTSDNGNEYFRWSHSSGSTNTEWMSLRSDGLRVGGTKVSLEGHSHNDLYYTKTEVNNKLNSKSDTSHTHDDRYLKLTGGIMTGTINRRSGGSTISGRDHAIIRLTYAPGGSSWNPIACVDTETGTWTLGHLSSGSSDTNFHFCFSTNADYNAGNNNGNYVTLRNKVGTIALLSDIPSSLKNPHALTISLNGTSLGPYDGSAAKNINITPSSIGAATSEHNHDNRYLKLTGGTMLLGDGLKFHADDNYFGTNSDARIISLLDGNGKVCDGGLIIDERATLDGKEYVTELLRIRDSEFKWKGSNILHSGNTYVSNNKGYINSTEITLVNNADTVDGYHASKFPYINNNGIWRIYGNAAVAALADNTAGLSSWAFGESRNYGITYLGILKPSTATCGINAHGTIAVFGQGDTHLGIASDYGSANLQVFGGNADKIVWRKKVAFTDSNVASATKLQTARLLWGQSFDGTGNIDGKFTMTKILDDYAAGVSIDADLNGQDNSRRAYIVLDPTSPIGKDSDYVYIGCDANKNATIGIPTGGNLLIASTLKVTSGNVNIFGTLSATNSITASGGFIGNASSATKLQTPRSIWGQSFDGTRDIPINVSAKMPFVYFKRFDNDENAGYVGRGSSSNNNIYIESYTNSNIILGLSSSNVGIGTNAPAYKLHVAGDIYTTTGFKKNGSSDSYVLLGGGGHKLESSLRVAYSRYLKGIALTGGNGNNAGYRLIFERTLGGWSINCGVWAIAFRHSGRGTLNIGIDTTNSDGSTYSYDIRFLGSTTVRDSKPFRAFYNTTTKIFRIYWYYHDYTSGEITVLRGDMEPYNGTWMTSLPNDVGTELSITCNMADLATNADMVDGVHVTWEGELTSTNYLAAWESNGSAIRAIKPSNVSVDNSDKVDGYHASDLVKFYLSPMANDATADSAKNWFVNTLPSSSGAIVYNVPGSEKTIIAGKSSSGAYGHMLQLNYDDTYLKILRYKSNSWKSTDWEKISAGYADSAGSATKLATVRTIWGQSFDGTNNISGDLTRVGSIYTTYDRVNFFNKNNLSVLMADHKYTILGYGTAGAGLPTYIDGSPIYMRCGTSYIEALTIINNGNVGIGTNTPSLKLDVVGNIRATGNSYATHFYESSDKTLKKNIKSILSSTNIPKIREFDWKGTGEHSYGFIALELEELGYGCLVSEANGKKTVNYTATLALTVAKLLNLINIQNKKISNLTKELKALKYGRKKNS